MLVFLSTAPISILSPVDPIREISAISILESFKPSATSFTYLASCVCKFVFPVASALVNITLAVFASVSPPSTESFPNLKFPLLTSVQDFASSLISVSYTHLTLPTNSLV